MSTKTVLLLLVILLLDASLWIELGSSALKDNPSYYQFDVGQGDSALIKLPDQVDILYDAGPRSQIVSDLSNILGNSNRRIEIVIISHPQRDHYFGLVEILKKFDIGLLITNGRLPQERELAWEEILHLLEEKKTPHLSLSAGDKITYSPYSLDILWPVQAWSKSGEPNDASLVVRADLVSGSLLLTGDIGGLAEDNLVSMMGSAIKSDVMKIPHHGSRFSSSNLLLQSVKPVLAVISSGKNNIYKHPHSEVVARLEENKIPVWRTDIKGGVSVEFLKDSLNIFSL